MGVHGAFFNVTGKPEELHDIMEGISLNGGRLDASESASLDLWLEMKDEWFRLHDATVISGATTRAPEGVVIENAGQFAALWNSLSPEDRERVWANLQSAAEDGRRCFMENHTGYGERNAWAKSEIQGLLDSLDSHVTHDEIYSQLKTIQERL